MKLVLGRQSQVDRRRDRSALGPLRHQLIQPTTVKRYAAAFDAFYGYVDVMWGVLPTIYEELDRCLAEYIESLWEDGAPKGSASYVVAATEYFIPAARRRLMLSWRLVGAWGRLELPARAPPMTTLVMSALAGLFIHWGLEELGLMMIVNFYCMFRTGEPFQVRAADVVPNGHWTRAVIRLTDTKTSKRGSGLVEYVNIDDGDVLTALKAVVSRRAPGELVMPVPPAEFRRLFAAGLKALRLTDCGYKPYSMRRGGATWLFRSTGNMQLVLERGRWANTKTARMYLTDGLASWQSLQIPPSTNALLQVTQKVLRMYIRRLQNGGVEFRH